MRTSKVSRDTAKLFNHVSGSGSLPRRATRSALAQFSYATPSLEDGTNAAELEDGASPPARKRRRFSAASPSKSLKSEPVAEGLSAVSSPPPPPPRRVRKPVRKAVDPSTGETTTAPPSDWEETYNLVKKMRAPGGVAYGAAVDTMGCERLADPEAPPKEQRFHTLVALMLSSQTKDTVNAVTMKRLKTELPPHEAGAPWGLNLDNMLAVEPKLLNELIWAVGFHNNKTKFLKQAAILLRDKWNGDIPDTIEGLTSLPGVGPKMAYLCMSVAWDRTEGIGVDVHVHRLTNLWGWQKTKTPEETRLSLQSWLPKDKWREINFLLVGFGQAVCLPVGRKCGDCELGLQGVCRAADRKKVFEGRRAREARTETEAVKTEETGRHQAMVKEEVVSLSLADIEDAGAAPQAAPKAAPGRAGIRRRAT